ncbi:hypothetical protein B0H67DRAFT_242965 [Lasiosphaeris hirsuta]|uniref:Uncharacterized protein n=1 Tax=Lasiosphaeris hirsuta TaxID=260670 RepID=A0AA40DU19_9PEZI|nr:hypothetical protein B0H67DRAFT_242965 [Lasiosphaeris hirsuta]
MRIDIFRRLPPPTVAILLTSILDLAAANALRPVPRGTLPATTTVPFHALNVISWPVQPTPPPVAAISPFDLFRRQDDLNTVCGYIGGDSDLPATCSGGSHCVLDLEHNVVGCCPNGQATCTQGVFTGCVDGNSDPQTEVNPYVYTCGGGNVCYKNEFDGGFSQFGCGTASDLATTVLATASDLTGTLTRTSMSISFTATASSLSTPTTLGTKTTSRTSSSSKSTSTSSTSSSSSSSGRPTGPPTGLPSGAPAPGNSPGAPGSDRLGAVVGGTLAGIGVLIAILALAFFAIRQRRRGNVRSGPDGAAPTFIPAPPNGGPPGAGFTPLHQDNESYETGMRPGAQPLSGNPVFSTDLTAGGPSPFAYQGAGTHTSYPPPGAGYVYPGQFPAVFAAGGGIGPGGAPIPGVAITAPSPVSSHKNEKGILSERGGESSSGKALATGAEDQVPLTRELDDFSQGFTAALGRIGEEEEDRDRVKTATGAGGVRPLWQQNRRQSRNLMWM